MPYKKKKVLRAEASFRRGYKDESGKPLTPSQTLSMQYYKGSRLQCQPIFGKKMKVYFQKSGEQKEAYLGGFFAYAYFALCARAALVNK